MKNRRRIRGQSRAREAPSKQRVRQLIAVAMLLLAVPPLRSADSPVSAELVVPEAQTHVIGDHTPLIWRFRNDGNEPLGFMWEGCCRLNGRLHVTAENLPVIPVPPGQALAHMFAKAERLDPGKPAEFETRLSDWVQLRESGDYQLEGRYTGVLPEQTPQVPRGLSLWRDAATTPPLRIRLTSAMDYLDQRSARAADRGLQLVLTGPSKLPPLEPSPYSLELHNTSTRDLRLAWPHDFQLWIIDNTGRRLGSVPTTVEGAYQEILLSPDARRVLTVPFHSGLIEGEPFGEYQVFVDVREGNAGEPRLPSNPLPLNWQLGPGEVERLLQQAVGGPKTGLRNAPLKLLRVYVGQLKSALAAVELAGAAPGLVALRDQLRLASCLKAHAPVPGRVELPLLVAVDGRTLLAGAAIQECLPSGPSGFDDVSRLQQLLNVRRHLGWEIGLDVKPEPAATLGVIHNALRPYSKGLELAGRPRALFPDASTNAPLALTFQPAPIPADMLLRLHKKGGAVVGSWARKTPPGGGTQQPSRFKPEEAFQAPYEPVSDWTSLAGSLQGQEQILALADPDLTWRELVDALQPLIAQRVPFDLCPLQAIP